MRSAARTHTATAAHKPATQPSSGGARGARAQAVDGAGWGDAGGTPRDAAGRPARPIPCDRARARPLRGPRNRACFFSAPAISSAARRAFSYRRSASTSGRHAMSVQPFTGTGVGLGVGVGCGFGVGALATRAARRPIREDLPLQIRGLGVALREPMKRIVDSCCVWRRIGCMGTRRWRGEVSALIGGPLPRAHALPSPPLSLRRVGLWGRSARFWRTRNRRRLRRGRRGRMGRWSGLRRALLRLHPGAFLRTTKEEGRGGKREGESAEGLHAEGERARVCEACSLTAGERPGWRRRDVARARAAYECACAVSFSLRVFKHISCPCVLSLSAAL